MQIAALIVVCRYRSDICVPAIRPRENTKEQSGESDELLPQDITHMDWLLENIVGRLPEMDELTPEGRDYVMLQGVTEQDEDGEEE